jgi:4-oxalocrotonate tautomerase
LRAKNIAARVAAGSDIAKLTMEARMPEVVVYLLEGRSLEQKRGLVKDITQAVVKNAGTTADQVTVSLVETPRTSKAKGGVLFSEMVGR